MRVLQQQKMKNLELMPLFEEAEAEVEEEVEEANTEVEKEKRLNQEILPQREVEEVNQENSWLKKSSPH